MRTRRRTSLLRFGTLLAFALALGACTKGGQFDPTTLLDNDMFEARSRPRASASTVFPNGVPGTQSGIPPDLYKGYQQPPEQAADNGNAGGAAAPAAPEPAKPKPKPRPRVHHHPANGAAGNQRRAWQTQAVPATAAGARWAITLAGSSAASGGTDGLAGCTGSCPATVAGGAIALAGQLPPLNKRRSRPSRSGRIRPPRLPIDGFAVSRAGAHFRQVAFISCRQFVRVARLLAGRADDDERCPYNDEDLVELKNHSSLAARTF